VTEKITAHDTTHDTEDDVSRDALILSGNYPGLSDRSFAEWIELREKIVTVAPGLKPPHCYELSGNANIQSALDHDCWERGYQSCIVDRALKALGKRKGDPFFEQAHDIGKLLGSTLSAIDGLQRISNAELDEHVFAAVDALGVSAQRQERFLAGFDAGWEAPRTDFTEKYDLAVQLSGRPKRGQSAMDYALELSARTPVEMDGGNPDLLGDFRGNIDQLLALMNKEFAFAMHGSDAVYFWKQRTRDGQTEWKAFSRSALSEVFANTLVPNIFWIRGTNRPKVLNAFELWSAWPKRRTAKGVGFYPGSTKNRPDVPDDYINTWSGFAVRPKKGSWARFKAHLLDNVCDGNEDHYNALMEWMAWCVQAPQKKPYIMVSLQGEEGCGKTFVVEQFGRLFGSHFVPITDAADLVGQFNPHLERAVVVMLDEAVWSGDLSLRSKMKGAVTGSVMRSEEKGKSKRFVPSYMHIMSTSNDAINTAAEVRSRRYFVLKCRPALKGKTDEETNQLRQKYFGAIAEEMDDGGREAFMYDLMKYPLPKSMPQYAPVTDALKLHRKANLGALDRWLLGVARDGFIDAPDLEGNPAQFELGTGEPCIVPSKSIVSCLESSASGAHERKQVEMVAAETLKALGVEAGRYWDSASKVRYRGWKFPADFDEFRKRVAEHLNMSVEELAADDNSKLPANTKTDGKVIRLHSRKGKA
jgi:Family of unknown function (DUF5906)